MAEADSCLKYALTMFPSALLPLLDKCGIEADAKAATRYIYTLNILLALFGLCNGTPPTVLMLGP